MIKKEKRAISPVIASVLLIAMAVILALIIFLWAKSFIGEDVIKNGEVIKNSCKNVVFDSEISGGELLVENKGNVALYGVAIKTAGSGKEELCYPFDGENSPTISLGESKALTLTDKCNGLSFLSGDKVTVMPVILGETAKGDRKYYTCEEFGEEVTIGV